MMRQLTTMNVESVDLKETKPAISHVDRQIVSSIRIKEPMNMLVFSTATYTNNNAINLE